MMRRSDWIWVAVLVVLLLLGYGLVPRPRDQEGADSYSIAYGGKRAFFELAQTLLEDVHRSSGSLLPPDDADTLVMLGPTTYPDRVQWQILHDWVSEGHSLVFAARWQDPRVELTAFDVRVEPAFGPTDEPEETQNPPPAEAPEEPLSTDLATGELEWMSNAHVETSAANADIAVTYYGSAQVIQQRVGSGILVVASSDYIFNNIALAEGDNGVLAFRILELAYPLGPVYFEESLNAAGPPKIVGLLFDDPLRPLTLQLSILSVLLVWMGSRRFGPAVTTRETRRRSLTEHAEALGNLHHRVGSGSRVVASYLEYFRQELRLHHQKSREASAVAERARVSVDSVRQILTQAERGAKNPNLERGKAARLVRSLAGLKGKAEGMKGATHGA